MSPRHRLFGLTGLFLLATVVAWAAQPGWWTDSGNGTAFIDGFAGSTSATNYELLNIGQLKNVATKAKIYLDHQLAAVGGAGTDVTALVNGFTHNSTTDYYSANLGQLKAVAKPFYDRLIAVGYNTNARLIAEGFPSDWAYNYPWNPSTPTSVNYALANLGQLKMVFSFNLAGFVPVSALDANGNGINDVWELALYGNLNTLTLSNWSTYSSTGAVPDYKNANPGSPANLTITISTPSNGTTLN